MPKFFFFIVIEYAKMNSGKVKFCKGQIARQTFIKGKHKRTITSLQKRISPSVKIYNSL